MIKNERNTEIGHYGQTLLTLTLGFTTSCEKEDENEPDDVTPEVAAPEVIFTQGDQTVDSGNEVVVTGEVEAPAGILEIEFFKDDVSFGQSITSNFDTDTSHSFTATIPGNQVDTTFSFKVQATDHNGETGSATATITVTEGPTITMEEYTSVSMFAQDPANDMAFNAETGASGTSVTVLEVGDVVAFQTIDGYKGLLKINTVTGTSISDANITFDVKTEGNFYTDG